MSISTTNGFGSGKFHAPVPVQRGWGEAVRVWWRELDKWLLGLIVLLMLLGTIAVAAASPAAGKQYGVEEFVFFKRHVVFQIMGIGVVLGASFVSREDARRLGILLAIGALFLLFLVPVIGVEKNGARRWLEFGMSLQPSEFLKPGFAILLAWMLSWRLRDSSLPVVAYSTLTMALIGALLMLQPNLGATILFGGVCLEGNAGLSTNSRAGAAFMAGCGPFTGMYFKFTPVGSFYSLTTAFQESNGKCLESNKPGVQLDILGATYMDDCGNFTGQRWRFTRWPTSCSAACRVPCWRHSPLGGCLGETTSTAAWSPGPQCSAWGGV